MSDRCKVLVFGGTTEGRILTEHLVRMHIDHEVSVATKYGRDILKDIDEDNLLVGRKDEKEIRKVIIDGGFNLVIDATHPFATEVSRQIKNACKEQGVTYLRLLRDTGKKASCSADHHEDFSTEVYTKGLSDVVYVDDIHEAIEKLKRVSGNILLLTGSKNLAEIAGGIPDSSKRLYARVLPSEDSIRKCIDAGLSGRQIIAMQGPFSKEMNIATIREVDAKAILTKESGRTGGFDEKIEAAYCCGIKAIVIRNPESVTKDSNSYSMEEILDIIEEKSGDDLEYSHNNNNKIITLAGIGPGGSEYYTRELLKALESADIIFGADAVLRNLDASVTDKLKNAGIPIVKEYNGEVIYRLLTKDINGIVNNRYTNAVILFSGDISLCSGAKKATEVFEQKGYEVRRISGISSVALFANKLFLSLENVKIVSAHGRKVNVRDYVETNKETIILPSDADDARNICKGLSDLNIRIVAGCNLGCNDEKIVEIRSITNKITNDKDDIDEDKGDIDKDKLNKDDIDKMVLLCSQDDTNNNILNSIEGKTLLYVYNENADSKIYAGGICDSDIIRGKTPMTKEEIRALSIRKLSLSQDAVVYDIGAGTGSISLEAALSSPDIKVFAIEKNEEAISLLSQNKEKFHVSNMEIVKGIAPDILNDLATPTHVFIGGSSGNMRDILKLVYDKNKNARVVINTVTAESFAEVMDLLKDYPYLEPDIIQVSVTRFRKAGRYHLADALNPVYIITLCTDQDILSKR